MLHQHNRIPLNNESFPCTACQAGIMQLRQAVYLSRLDNDLLIIPNFPAWICDLCGQRDYDEQALNWLSAFLDPSTGHKITISKNKPKLVTGKHKISHAPSIKK